MTNGDPDSDVNEPNPSYSAFLIDTISFTVPDINITAPGMKARVQFKLPDAGMWMGSMFDVNSASQSYIRSAGHLGWAFPAGLGAKCAAPERPVVVFTGDSGFWYHIAEIETAVRWNINSVTVVNNNGGGNQSKRGFDRAYGGQQTEKARELWTFRAVNFARIAEEIGALGIRIERPSELSPALYRAVEADRPVVLDVVTDIEALAPLAV